ncbi:MAG: hypothetical protein ACLQAT_04860 [Candidatus Binataceae bacterium]
MRGSIVALIAMLFLAAFPAAQATAAPSGSVAGIIYGYQICRGQYALCAASTCTLTGGTISVHVAGGGMASFPEASCTCPVYNGPAIADVTGGNMQGSCDAPGKGQVWSLYWPKTNIPQEANGWSHKPADTAVSFQLCSSSDNVGATFANCFSFACTLDAKRQNGVKTATCKCPLGENPDGSAVSPDTAVFTPAGQCDSAVCSDHPVGAAFAGANGDANECLGSESASSLPSELMP